MIQKTIVRRDIETGIRLSSKLHPVLERVYAARNVNSLDDIDYSLARLLPYKLLSNIEEAAQLLVTAVTENKRILIVADYDADGATACAVAIRGLKSMGAAFVDFIVPDRFVHGYGLSPEVVELASTQSPELLITVDNGISSLEGVNLARQMGIEVLITDHHIPGDELPNANVIVNPNLPNDAFPSKALAGVGVMFYVLAALRNKLKELNWFEQKQIAVPNLAALLDLVALGTVADVVPLDFNNRLLVAQGLHRIRQKKCVPGISSLLLVSKRNPASIVASDLGFALGPRLNAAGRLTDMRLGIECLCSDDEQMALQLAGKLDALNRERREIQSDMEEDARLLLDELDFSSAENLPCGICLYRENWHQGVVGVLASRIKEFTHRPVIVFAKESDHQLKGSARSIKGVHIRDVLESIATANPGLLSKYGGHAMAAGLSLDESNYQEFCERFDRAVEERIKTSGFDNELVSDGELEANEINLGLGEQLKSAGPWGQGFPEPLFDGVFKLLEKRVVGEQHLKLRLGMSNNDKEVDAIAFYTSDADWPEQCDFVRLAYHLDVNEFRGRKTPQLLVNYIEPTSEPASH